ncbi:MAG TPA: cytochrome d ubiquinol oxidase subunit II [Candidatus Binataceae bacterium]|nr:cytochrome d ubiquinol oxidase subunit II [Candidatus Binataceae bacterium]
MTALPYPLLFVAGILLVALTIYVLTGGADYGGGVWNLFASGPRAAGQRDLIERAIGPIWEADHVWLILVVVIMFDAFPPAFAQIMTAMHIPVTLMLVGIVLRGSAFSFHSYGGGRDSAQRRWGRLFAIASLVTPVLLGVIIGAIASARIPRNPARLSDFVAPWATPFCFSVGLFALVMFAYLAAVYAPLETDDAELRDDFRRRALGAAVAVGLMAAVVLLLSIHGAPLIWAGLTERVWTWPLIWIITILALAAIGALWTRRFALARLCAAGQVALILWGWALAQFPYLLPPDLTIYNSSAPPVTIHILAGALAAGALILLPSYRYLLVIFKSHPERRRLRGRRRGTLTGG